MTGVNCPKCNQPVDLPDATDDTGVEVNDFPCPNCGEEIALVKLPPAEPSC
jgi:endogenous inhibitor of DNA gyrase (YacG/DUF329 family)